MLADRKRFGRSPTDDAVAGESMLATNPSTLRGFRAQLMIMSDDERPLSLAVGPRNQRKLEHLRLRLHPRSTRPADPSASVGHAAADPTRSNGGSVMIFCRYFQRRPTNRRTRNRSARPGSRASARL